VGADGLPVLVKVAQRVVHRVRVLAHDHLARVGVWVRVYVWNFVPHRVVPPKKVFPRELLMACAYSHMITLRV